MVARKHCSTKKLIIFVVIYNLLLQKENDICCLLFRKIVDQKSITGDPRDMRIHFMQPLIFLR